MVIPFLKRKKELWIASEANFDIEKVIMIGQLIKNYNKPVHKPNLKIYDDFGKIRV